MNQLDQTTYTTHHTTHTHTILLGATIQQYNNRERRLGEQQKRILYEPRSGARSSSQLVQHSRGIDDNIHSFDQTADDADDDGDDFHYGPGFPPPTKKKKKPYPSELPIIIVPPSTGRPPKRSPKTKPKSRTAGNTKTYCQSSSNSKSNYGNIIGQQQQHAESQQQHNASLH
ncbi:LOW QUALITY PROTEIN: uncharacterized protein LOC108145799 [Drosophila elegans]|uniref:LOW QUALITY PROTEIN: uncharacterized protein LOC108145799 n=1 Tax=Drosophila elegans TaxID=30023 RepID=UPI001BC856C1|nr:LOW QUALITY PROTEIN: uncharacterized protein LOC108145799 [Drosophila elegans]